MILISPWSKSLRWGGDRNPKNPPEGWWESVVFGLNQTRKQIFQVGLPNEKKIGLTYQFLTERSLAQLGNLVLECDCWISVDNFFPHLANLQKKRGVVIYSQSDPRIFGYPYNINLYKPEYLRERQFWLWEQAEYKAEAFVEPKIVVDAVNQILREKK